VDFLKPMGKGLRDGEVPNACMCSSWEMHQVARQDYGPIIGCLHCGCACGGNGEYKTGNRVAAVTTISQK
jgi:putative bacteriocin precursor